MTGKQREELYICNINDFINKNFKSFKSDNDMDYINKSIAYILKYGTWDRYTTCKLQDLVYTFRNQMAIVIAKKQLEKDPNDLTNMQSENDKELKYFIKDPVSYIQSKLENDEYYNSIKPTKIEGLSDLENKGYIKRIDASRTNLVRTFKTSFFKMKYVSLENKKILTRQLLESIGDKIPESNSSIDVQLEKQKGGLAERIFRRTSKQYKRFKNVIKDYRNRNKDGYGDSKALEKSAMDYLRHKFPDLKDGELPTLEQINTLDSTGKERATFCLKVVNSIRETNQVEKMVTAVKGLNLNPNDLYSKSTETINSETPNSTPIKKSSLKKSSLKNSNEIQKSTKRKVQFNLENKTPVRTKTKGGPENVPLKPNRIIQHNPNAGMTKSQVERELLKQEMDEIKDLENVTESKPVVKEIAPDNNSFQEALKEDVDCKMNKNIEPNDIDLDKTLDKTMEIEN